MVVTAGSETVLLRTCFVVLDGGMELGRRFRHLATLVGWELELFTFELLFAAFEVDLETGFAILPATDVADEHVGTSCL